MARSLGTLTVIVGLCGSGKSWLLAKFHREHPDALAIDEAFSDCGKHKPRGDERRRRTVEALRAGKDVYVADLFIGRPCRRRAVLRELRKSIPDLRVVWLCYEVNRKAADHNCRKRDRGKRDSKGHIRINRNWAPVMKYPRDAVILKIHRLS